MKTALKVGAGLGVVVCLGVILSSNLFLGADERSQASSGEDLEASISEHTEQRVPVDAPRVVKIPTEYAVPVKDRNTQLSPGFVDSRVVFPTDREKFLEGCFEPAPVVDEQGSVVGYFFRDFGYVALEVVEQPGFSIDDLRSEQANGKELRSTCVQTPEAEAKAVAAQSKDNPN